jgi:hypothetical protein
MHMKKIISAAIAMAITAPAFAGTLYHDKFDGNANSNLSTQTFASGATTDFNYWGTQNNSVSNPVGGDMDAGYFSVVNKAQNIHSQFITALDADGNANGSYAVYNGFANGVGISYNFTSNSLVAGLEHTFSADLIAIALPQFTQDSNIEFSYNGVPLTPIYNLPGGAVGNSWRNVAYSFVPTSASGLFTIKSLAGASNSGNDFGLDNVKITVVPLPTSALMGAGLLGVLAVRRMMVKA